MVRKDIPLAHQAVQAAHAAIAAARDFLPVNQIHPNLVLCTVPDESALLSLRDDCQKSGVPARVFVEADMGDQVTALATAPIGKDGRRVFKNLPLFTGV